MSDPIGQVKSLDELPKTVRQGRRSLWQSFPEFPESGSDSSEQLKLGGYVPGKHFPIVAVKADMN